MNELYFSVLSYYPSYLTTENIVIGILFHFNNSFQFEATRNFTRIEHFDDELDISYLKNYLLGIKRELEDVKNDISFEEYIGFYVNELKFSKPQKLITNDVPTSIEDTRKIFLRYEIAKMTLAF